MLSITLQSIKTTYQQKNWWETYKNIWNTPSNNADHISNQIATL